jgi:hypothetical protein
MSIPVVTTTLVGLLMVGAVAWWGWRFLRLRQRGMLRLRAMLTPGLRGDVMRVRIRLHDNVTQTHRVLRHPAAVSGMPAETRALLTSLKQLAAGLDDQLRLWQTEPDRALVAGAFPPLRDRAETLIAQAVALRLRAIPHIEETDRLSRMAAEEELRRQLTSMEAERVAPARLAASSAVQRGQPPPTSSSTR